MYAEQAVELEKFVTPEDAVSNFTHMLARASAAASRSTIDEDKRAQQEEKALGLYKKLINDRKLLEEKGKTLVLEAVDFCAKTGRKKDAGPFSKRGWVNFQATPSFTA